MLSRANASVGGMRGCCCWAASFAGEQSKLKRLQHIDQCGGRPIHEVIRSYSPHLIFHEKEQFFPSSVEWYLNITNLRMVARVVHWAPVPAEELKFYGDETYLIKGTWWSGEKIFNNPGEFNDPSARSGDFIVAPAYVT
eukprot:Sspe_Gene.350::Locus_120_Transcript_4_10_Confidence_0.310_Length_453::g.350::m.350